jgi:SPP1 gp7 family putative phage head morphogenesis protein
VFKRIDHQRDTVTDARAAIERRVKAFLAALRDDIAAAVALSVDRVARDQKPKHPADEAAEKAEWNKLADAVRPHLRVVAKDGAREGLLQVLAGGAGGDPPDDINELLELANDNAIAWAEERAAELVTEIDETTRTMVRDMTTQALEEGMSNDELADALIESGAFTDSRAEKIARTETAMADVQGNKIGWREAGVVIGKQWIVDPDGACEDCASLDGEVVPLDSTFSGGRRDPPLHPHCECDLLPVLEDEED